MAFHEFGRRRVADGTFNLHTDFGLLRRDELREAVVDPGKFTDELRVREALLARGGRRCRNRSCSPEVGPTCRRTRGAMRPRSRRVVDGEAVQGVPGCPGIAKGIARVVTDSHDPTALEPGDILVAPITDPSWTPLFVPAAGVVVDVGAPLSHAIIVSRELGIPCVVSATDATRRIPDGALVEVNGDTGVVTVLSLP